MAMAKKKNNGIPSGYVRTVTENDHDIVSPPIKIFFLFHSYVSLPDGRCLLEVAIFHDKKLIHLIPFDDHVSSTAETEWRDRVKHRS